MKDSALAGLVYCLDDLSEPASRVPIGELLRDIFEIDPAAFNRLEFWDHGYRSFSYRQGDSVAANVSSFPMPLVIGGEEVAAGGLQSVATRPAYRRRGLFADLMERAIADADARFAVLLLYTDNPSLYEPFGFRLQRQSSFFGRFGSAQPTDVRRLSLGRSDDAALVRRLFAERQAPSRHLGLKGHQIAFFLNAIWYQDWRLDYLPDHHVLVAHDHSDNRPRLLDLVGPEVPPLDCLAAVFELGDQELEVCFPPDRLGGTFLPRPHHDPEAGQLMVRGRFPIEGTPLRLPPTAAF